MDYEKLAYLLPSIFAFQNQLDSLLEEELILLHGRNDDMATTKAKPVYNRLIWNFTRDIGEVAYTTGYNISDMDNSGVIDLIFKADKNETQSFSLSFK